MKTIVHRTIMTVLFGSLLTTASLANATTIVNISGAGPEGSGTQGPTSYPLAPGALVNLVNPAVVDLPAGHYSVSDAWGQPGAIYDAWNFQVSVTGSWDSHFYVAVEQGTSSTYRLLLDGRANTDPSCTYHFCAWATEAQASAAFLATPAFSFDLASDTAVAFVADDYYLLDNAGGISLALTSSQVAAVPEPSEIFLLLASLPLIGGVLIGRRRTVDGINA